MTSFGEETVVSLDGGDPTPGAWRGSGDEGGQRGVRHRGQRHHEPVRDDGPDDGPVHPDCDDDPTVRLPDRRSRRNSLRRGGQPQLQPLHDQSLGRDVPVWHGRPRPAIPMASPGSPRRERQAFSAWLRSVSYPDPSRQPSSTFPPTEAARVSSGPWVHRLGASTAATWLSGRMGLSTSTPGTRASFPLSTQ